ncbi:PDZ/DHR/GLGF domain protein [Ostertagia ostertagi]
MTERFEMVSRGDSTDGDLPGMRFVVTLVKDPSSGLGLTLVDGNLNGVKGVYVKSVAENGAGMRAKSNLEWTDELEEVGEEAEVEDDIIYVELERNSVGSLGVQIASVSGRVCIKQLTAEPAASHPDIHVGDALIYVNGEPVSNKSHQEVVSMLRSGGNVVTLGLRRESQKNGNIITAVLEKKPEGSLGLSLAKRTGSDGIFIRMIAVNSAAAMEGSLRVGDRLLSLDGESVTDLTPTAILERLRSIQGAVHITVSRDSQ